MKYKIFLPYIFLLFISLNCFGQGKKYVYYLDDNLNPVDKSKSVFTGTGIVENNLIALRIQHNKTNQTTILAHYTDSSLKVSQGLFQSYFLSGGKESEGTYQNNKEDGVWKKWNSEGKLIDSTAYDRGKKISSATYTYYLTGDYTYHFDDFKNDRMQTLSYNDSGKITSEASFAGLSGIVKQYNKEGIKTDSVFSKEETEALYPGGDAAWNKYIQDKIVQNIDAITKDNKSGTCKIKFIVDKEGKIKDVEAITMKGSVLAEVAIKAIRNSSKWKPAMQYGRAVNAYRIQPVSFSIQNK